MLQKDSFSPEQLAYQLSDGYFAIFASSEGFDYSFYDAQYNQIDGGIYDDDTVSIYTAIEEIAQDNLTRLSPELVNYKDLPMVDFEDLTEQAEAVEMAKITQYTATLPDLKITDTSDHIKVDGHIGTWYVVDTEQIDGKSYFLLEHETYGDSAACVIVDSQGKLVLDDVWNGFDDLTDYLDDLKPEILTPEQTFLHTDNSYAIYQLKHDDSNHYHRFTGTADLHHFGMKPLDHEAYDVVYVGNLTPNTTLEGLYETFNLHHPEDFHSHSLSVSDVVGIRKSGKTTFHFVDSYGFTEMPRFLHSAELGIGSFPKQEPPKEKPSVLEKLQAKLPSRSYAPIKPPKNTDMER